MNEQQQPQPKTMVGVVTSDKMQQTVAVEVTTFKVHPLYHKRYRWTTKYLADTSQVQPQVGDTVRIEASKPISKLKRWIVKETITQANPANETTKVKVAPKKAPAKPKAAAKKK